MTKSNIYYNTYSTRSLLKYFDRFIGNYERGTFLKLATSLYLTYKRRYVCLFVYLSVCMRAMYLVALVMVG